MHYPMREQFHGHQLAALYTTHRCPFVARGEPSVREVVALDPATSITNIVILLNRFRPYLRYPRRPNHPG